MRTVVSCIVAIWILCSCATASTAPTPAPPQPREPGPPPSYGPQVCAYPEATVYEASATALARMEEPELGYLESEVVLCAFLQVFGADVRDRWFSTFRARVAELSRGSVRLEQADPNRFRFRVKGLAMYLVLIRGDITQKLTLGPYMPPVRFWE